MTLEQRVEEQEKAVKAKQESTAMIEGIIQEIYQSSIFLKLQEKLREY